MPELTSLLIESRKQKSEDRKFFAALQNIDLDAGATEDALSSVQQRARVRVAEMTGEKPMDDDVMSFMDGLDYEDLTGGTNG